METLHFLRPKQEPFLAFIPDTPLGFPHAFLNRVQKPGHTALRPSGTFSHLFTVPLNSVCFFTVCEPNHRQEDQLLTTPLLHTTVYSANRVEWQPLRSSVENTVYKNYIKVFIQPDWTKTHLSKPLIKIWHFKEHIKSFTVFFSSLVPWGKKPVKGIIFFFLSLFHIYLYDCSDTLLQWKIKQVV